MARTKAGKGKAVRCATRGVGFMNFTRLRCGCAATGIRHVRALRVSTHRATAKAQTQCHSATRSRRRKERGPAEYASKIGMQRTTCNVQPPTCNMCALQRAALHCNMCLSQRAVLRCNMCALQHVRYVRAARHRTRLYSVTLRRRATRESSSPLPF